MLLTADWHLDDKPENEYRWRIFDRVREQQGLHPAERRLVIAGDLGDKADRHSSTFVNRLVAGLQSIVDGGCEVRVICGNHDEPVNGPPYWSFLNAIPGIAFITQPEAIDGMLLLPHAANPAKAWEHMNWTCRCAIMHQPIAGAVANNGFKLGSDKMPMLPRGPKYYSGDIHTPQKVGRVEYIGAPHPVAYGDGYHCRMLVLDDASFAIVREVDLNGIGKHQIGLEIGQLPKGEFLAGDQAKIRVFIPLTKMAEWPAEEAALREWALKSGISLASIEPVIQGDVRRPAAEDAITDPLQILADYIDAQADMPDDLARAGIDLFTKETGVQL